MNLFYKRKLVVATRHMKERVIAPVLEFELGVHCIKAHDLNTDVFGTFTGEVERTDDPLSTLRKKCLTAMELAGTDLAVATEGSFGQHPYGLFSVAGDELMMLMDAKHQIELVVRECSTETNFSGKEIHSENELLLFAQKALFPSHALILRKDRNSHEDIFKGINQAHQLLETYSLLSKKYESVFVETDMRAMNNPTRMRKIGELTRKLVADIRKACPQCNMPGFVITEKEPGLECENCMQATRTTKKHIYICKHCSYRYEESDPLKKGKEEPTYCDYCNP